MKKIYALALASLLVACQTPEEKKNPIVGTWLLISGLKIEKGDSTFTDFQKGQRFIKIINNDHFAFLRHDLTGGKDSTALFAAGGGAYTLKDSLYTENLEYCSAREWENHTFPFIVTLHGDTLVQRGEEKMTELNVNHVIIETYVRLKSETPAP